MTLRRTAMGKMKAAFLEKPGKIVFRDIDKPYASDGNALVRLEYVGICGSDVHFYEDGKIGDFVVREPLILGHEAAGVVEEVGSGVSNLKPGDRVAIEPGLSCGKCSYCTSGRYNLCDEMAFLAAPPVHGVFKEFVDFPADRLFQLPDNVSTREGALVEPLSIGVYAATRAGVSAGKRIVVLGAGCIGLVTLLACKAMGAAEVHVVDRLANRLALAKKVGASSVIDATSVDPVREVLRLTAGSGADIVIECAGANGTMEQTVNCVRKGGTVVFVGMNSSDQVPININRAIGREVDFKTIFRYVNIFPVAISLLGGKKIDAEQIITRDYSFQQIPEAFQFVSQNKAEITKAMIRIS
jgi:L-iditol 2-dehydrogenase